MKKIICILTAAIMIITFAGCSGKDKDRSEEDVDVFSAPDTSNEAQETTSNADSGNIKLEDGQVMVKLEDGQVKDRIYVYLKVYFDVDASEEYVSQQQLDSLEGIGFTSENISSEFTEGDWNNLKKLKNLKKVALGNSEYITDITPLKDIKTLEEVNLMFSAVSDISPLLELPNLKKIWIRGCPIEDKSILEQFDCEIEQ